MDGRNLFLTILETRKSKMKFPGGSVSSEDGLQT